MPTLEEFASRFIEGYAVANRQKPSGIAAKQTILDVHLVPAFRTKRLDVITNEDIQRLKQAMRGAPGRAIQELAGQQDLITTQRYMHLSPAAIEGAIRLLDQTGPPKGGHYVRSATGRSESGRGEILETADLESAISNP